MKKIDIKRRVFYNVYPTAKEHIVIETSNHDYGVVNYYLIRHDDKTMWNGLKRISTMKSMVGEKIELEDIPFVLIPNKKFHQYSHTLTDFIVHIDLGKYAYHFRMRNVFNETR